MMGSKFLGTFLWWLKIFQSKKGGTCPSMSVEQVLSEHHILNSAYCTKICFPKNKLNIKLLHNMLTEHIVN